MIRAARTIPLAFSLAALSGQTSAQANDEPVQQIFIPAPEVDTTPSDIPAANAFVATNAVEEIAEATNVCRSIVSAADDRTTAEFIAILEQSAYSPHTELLRSARDDMATRNGQLFVRNGFESSFAVAWDSTHDWCYVSILKNSQLPTFDELLQEFAKRNWKRSAIVGSIQQPPSNAFVSRDILGNAVLVKIGYQTFEDGTERLFLIARNVAN